MWTNYVTLSCSGSIRSAGIGGGTFLAGVIKSHIHTSACNEIKYISITVLTLSVPETQIAEFVNSVDLDEVAH